ncbi:hypothetical protein [Azospirillum canadense]|uniref:hypothetical protein n=1 Tax=Azospirillum canadense TaxID=403962 RepID=UPI002227A361|nr:hypothetical protein [Azospirillum canadense]MCW2242552.1 hypothetical protein [Azospirillum canadense]
MASRHKWAFRSKLRTSGFGWRGSKTAVTRLKEAVSEIKTAAKSDPLTAGEGAVVLAERVWPAFQDIDTSSGALGRAVHDALEAVIPILIAAPTSPKMRAAWLERLYEAIQDDGVQYLWPIEERWGEIAVYPELMNEYADRLLPLLRRVWSGEVPGGYVVGGTICLSCLLEVGRYGDLLELLRLRDHRFWSDHRYGAEALARQGLYEAALAYAEACRDSKLGGYDERRIDRFCESVLLKAGREEEAYRRFGLRAGAGVTYLATYRDTLRRYPGKEPRQVLLDLIAARGEKGKWFAAAKDASFFDIALDCAGALDAEPATLVRAARDFGEKDPTFAAQVALHALWGLLNGAGYDPSAAEVNAAYDHLLVAASRIGAEGWAREQAATLAAGPCSPGREPMRQALASLLEHGHSRLVNR